MKNPNLIYKPRRAQRLFGKKVGTSRAKRAALATILPIASTVFGMPDTSTTRHIYVPGPPEE